MKFGGISSRTSTDIDCNLRQVGLFYPQDECSGKNRKNNSKVVFEQRILVHLVIGWDLESCKLVCIASMFHSTLIVL